MGKNIKPFIGQVLLVSHVDELDHEDSIMLIVDHKFDYWCCVCLNPTDISDNDQLLLTKAAINSWYSEL
jgi:hypothetical protein